MLQSNHVAVSHHNTHYVTVWVWGGSMGGGLLVGYGYPGKYVDDFYQSHRVVTVRNTEFKRCRATWWWPLFDAFQNLYVDQLRFWIGIQLLLRVASLSIASFQQLTNIGSVSLRNFTLFFMIMLLTTFTVAEAFFKPFKGVIRNVVDLIFLINLIYLLFTALYYNLLRLSIQADEKDVELIREVHSRSVQAMVIILIAFIITGFLVVHFGLLKLFVKRALPRFPQQLQNVVIVFLHDAGYTKTDVCHNRVRRQRNVAQTPTTTIVSIPRGSSSDQEPEELELRPQRLQSEMEYSRYRDSILENISSSLSVWVLPHQLVLYYC